MFRWLLGKGARPAQVQRTLAAIDTREWAAMLVQHPFLYGLDSGEEEALRERSAWLLASKTFSGAQGMKLTPAMKLSIAVQAALPIMRLDPRLYEGWTEIIVYPGGFLIPRNEVDESGVVHQYVEEAAGEAWEGGPLILSWDDCGPGMQPGINVVIHEFAHKLDLFHGEADGMPWLGQHGGRLSPQRWRQVLEQSYEAFCNQLDEVEAAIPADVDPESEAAAPWYGTLPLDPYAASDEAEFFAVSAEAFFVDPAPLAGCYPEWYALLAAYFRQDPLARMRLHPEPPPPLP